LLAHDLGVNIIHHYSVSYSKGAITIQHAGVVLKFIKTGLSVCSNQLKDVASSLPIMDREIFSFAFENLKRELCSDHVFIYPDGRDKFIPATDCSNLAMEQF
jgi:hypothetical protein